MCVLCHNVNVYPPLVPYQYHGMVWYQYGTMVLEYHGTRVPMVPFGTNGTIASTYVVLRALFQSHTTVRSVRT
jgi:hypothetical protein